MPEEDPPSTWVERAVTISRTQGRVIATVAAAVAVFVISVILVERLVPQLSDPLWLRRQILAFGAWAPVAYIGVQAAQVVLAPIPGQVVAFVGGYLFGVVYGTLYSLVGAAIGSTIVFALARRWGRPYVERVLPAETLGTFDGIVAKEGRLGMFLVFLIPGLPDDAICVLGGVTKIPIWQLVLISIVGRIPGYLAVAYAGAGFAAANYLETAVVIGALAVAAFLGYRNRDRILTFLDTHRW